MIRWLVLAFLVSSSQASRPRGIRAEVICSPVTPLTPKLKKSQIIQDAIEHLLILLFLAINCLWKIVEGFCLQVASLYNPGADFRCFDGSNTIPFIQVNDDYCDCEVREHFLALPSSIFEMVRMGQMSQAPLPVPMENSFARMLGTRPWSFPPAG